MMARKKPITTLNAAELGVDTASRLTLIKVAEPEARKAGLMVNSVEQLLGQLRDHEGINL
jgi:electron transfer flavoprotein beta subunit